MSNQLSLKDQIEVRREAIQVAAGAARHTGVPMDIIFDAARVYDFCVEGKLPPIDQAEE
jgi:hypothetical protein